MKTEMSVLYVEDETMVRETTARSLRRFFRDVALAENGEEGLRIFKELYPDLVITDINMPRMDGIEMIQGIRKLKADQPILVISAYDFSDLLKPFLEKTVNGFIPKPFSLKHIEDFIEKLQRGEA